VRRQSEPTAALSMYSLLYRLMPEIQNEPKRRRRFALTAHSKWK
jgi:hypothetical protein